MMDVIRKKPKIEPRESGIAGAIATGGMTSGMNNGERGGGPNATMMGM
jgi:hypothetical protein